MKKHNFSAGPSILPQEVFEKAAQAVLDFNGMGLSILEISHRSKEFIAVIEGHLDQYSKTEKTIFDYLIPLYEITKKFRKRRLLKGYDFRTTENRLKLRNDNLESIEVETSTASHQLVEECMLLANIEASKKVNTVGIYRIHEEPPFKAISKLVDDVNILGVNVKLQSDVHDTITHIQEKAKISMMSAEIDELIIQAQTQAKYSSKNLGHFGLGFSSYSHFTSPIRRYSDLVLHRILKTKQTPKNIDEIFILSSNKKYTLPKSKAVGIISS
jgi:ribonuclease R